MCLANRSPAKTSKLRYARFELGTRTRAAIPPTQTNWHWESILGEIYDHKFGVMSDSGAVQEKKRISFAFASAHI